MSTLENVIFVVMPGFFVKALQKYQQKFVQSLSCKCSEGGWFSFCLALCGAEWRTKAQPTIANLKYQT